MTLIFTQLNLKNTVRNVSILSLNVPSIRAAKLIDSGGHDNLLEILKEGFLDCALHIMSSPPLILLRVKTKPKIDIQCYNLEMEGYARALCITILMHLVHNTTEKAKRSQSLLCKQP